MSRKQLFILGGGAALIAAVLTAVALLLTPPFTQPTALPTIAALPDGIAVTAAPGLTTVVIPAEPVPDRVVLRFASDADPAQVEAYLAQVGGTTVQQIDALNTVVLDLPQGAEKNLPTSPLLEEQEPDFFAGALLDVPTSDPRYAEQWALPVIGAPDAWLRLPENTPDITVAVVDSGVCASHPDLAGRVLAGRSFVDNVTSVDDLFGHGCAVSGIIAANIDDGIGMAGAASNVNILPLRVLNDQGIGTYSSVAAAIVYAADNGAQIINLSLGGSSPSGLLESAVNYAVGKGALVIAAAGNTGTEGLYYPARYPAVVAVGSVDPTLERSSFSAYGDGLDLLAPGRSILSLKPDGSYTTVSGTSFAAPYAAGVAALEIALGGELVVDGGIAHVQSASAPPPPVPTVPPETSANRISQDVLDELAANGSARVIVALNTPIAAQAASAERAALVAQAQESVLAQLAETDFVLAQQFTLIPGFAGLLTSDGVSVLQADENVLSVYIDEPVTQHDIESGPLIGSDFVNANLGVTGAGVRVAVLDTGIDSQREGIAGSVVAEHCIASGESLEGGAGGCPNGQVTQDGPGSAADGPSFHGTNVAAIITADPGGVAPQAEIVAVRVLDQFGRGFTSDWIAGLNWIAQNNASLGVDVVNMSLGTLDLFAPAAGSNATSCNAAQNPNGTPALPAEIEAVQLVRNAGITIVSSTGNGGNLQGISAPACLDGVISVGAVYDSALGAEPDNLNGLPTTYRDRNGPSWPACTDTNAAADQITCFTNRNVWVDILAPGAQIIVAKTGGAGTSQASPHVAAVAALLQDAAPTALTPDQVEDLIKGFGPTVTDPATGLAFRRLDARSSVESVLGAVPVFSCANVTDVPESECQALTALYLSTNGDQWTINTNWLQSTEVCTWFGISCEPESEPDRVYQIRLNNNNLTGTLPPLVGGLERLYLLELSDNPLTGFIPANLDGSSNLHILRIANTLISGEIPESLGNLALLQQVFLNDNQLTGSIPASLGGLANLNILDLRSNALTGSIPVSLGNLAQLQVLDFSDNQLNGTIPPELGNLINLDDLDLQFNQLAGSLPPELGNLSGLISLSLQGNGLSGSIPAQWSGMINLRAISLQSNRISGQLPDFFSTFPGLLTVDFSGNRFSGSLPASWGSSPQLVTLDLYDNDLTGTIPPEWGSLPLIDYLDIHQNNLTGTIPATFGNLTTLRYLNLSGNSLTGTIPDIGSLSILQTLDLSYNNLQGPVPESLTTLGALTSLNLGVNALFVDDFTYSLEDFLNTNDPDWASTQTRTPSISSSSQNNPNTAAVSFTSTGFTNADTRYNLRGVSSFTGAEQTDTAQTSPGLLRGLTPGDTYQLQVQTVNAFATADGDALTVISPWSPLDADLVITLTGSDFCNSLGESPAYVDCNALVDLYYSTGGENWNDNTNWLTTSSGGGSDLQLVVGGSTLDTLSTDALADLTEGTWFTPASSIGIAVQSDDNQRVAAAETGSSLVTIYDSNGGVIRSINFITLFEAPVTALEFINNEGGEYWLIVGSQSGRVVIVNADTSTLIDEYTVPDSLPVINIAARPDGQRFVISQTETCNIYTYAVGNLEPLGSYTTCPNDVSSAGFELDFSSDNEVLAVASRGADLVYLYTDNGEGYSEQNDFSGQASSALESSTDGVNDIELSPDGSVLITGTNNGYLAFYGTQVLPGYLIALADFAEEDFSPVTSVAFDITSTAENIVAYAGSENGNLRAWSGIAFVELAQIDTGDDPVTAILFNTAGGGTGSGINVCTWFGITCDPETFRVVQINLPANNLVGALPASVANLTELNTFDVEINQLEGTVPTGIWNLTGLTELALYSNNFTGEIPSAVGNLTNLSYLSLGINDFSGGIPTEIGNLTALQYLFLNQVGFTGEIPASLGNLTDLIDLYLNGNALSGGIPESFTNLSSIEKLFLQGNALSGSIPDWFNTLTNLQNLDLSTNLFSGEIPATLGDLANLRDLFLCVNQLTGEIPASLGRLTELRRLQLYDNQLTGSIPAQLGQLENLTDLQLQDNQLTGSIPASLGELSALVALILDGNELTGAIPPALGNLTQLERLILEDNQLSGSIPPELGQLTKIDLMYLNQNQLTGEIPPELGNLTTMRSLLLYWNALEGDVPSALTGLTNLIDTPSVGLGLSFNALTVSDEAALAFLNVRDPNWQNSQTVPPSNFALGFANGTALSFTWDPIPFTSYDGYYRVECAPTSDAESWTEVGRTSSKSDAVLSAPNLAQILEGEQGFCRIRTVTEGPLFSSGAVFQQNTIISQPSAPIEVVTPVVPDDGTVIIPTIPSVLTITPGDDAPGFVPPPTCTQGRSVIFEGRSVIFEGRSVIFEGRSVIFEGRSVIFEGSTEGSNYDTVISIWSVPASDPDQPAPPLEEVFSNPDLHEDGCNDNTDSSDLPPGDTERPPGSESPTSRVAVPWDPDRDYYVVVYSKDPNPATLRLTVDLKPVGDVQTVPQSEANALVDLYLNTSGPNWTQRQNWLLNADPCTWFGVICANGHITGLTLEANGLRGELPASLADLPFLEVLSLQENAIIGQVPVGLTNAVNLSALNLVYNGLFTIDPAVDSFITTRSGAWDQSQTVPPTSVAVTAGTETTSSFEMAWSPIDYTADGGFYRVPCAITSGGPYVAIPANQTTDKFAAGLTLSQLLPGTTYYCAAQTYTPPHNTQKNEIFSVLSSEVSTTTLLPEGLEGSAPAYSFTEGVTFPFIFQGSTAPLPLANSALPSPTCGEASGRSVIFEGRSVIFEGRSVIFEGRSVIFEGSGTEFSHTVSIWSAPAGSAPSPDTLTQEACGTSEPLGESASAQALFTANAQAQVQPGRDYYVMISGNNFAGGNVSLQLNVLDDGTGNAAPVAVDDTVSTTVDTPVVINVRGNDTDADHAPAALTVSNVTQGTSGSVVNNNNGTVTYTPNSGFTGTDTFTYTLCDPVGACDNATVLVTVTGGDGYTTQPQTLVVQVNTGSDDANEDGSQFDLFAPTMWVGNGSTTDQSYAGLRFNGITIPPGSTIVSAHIELYSPFANWINTDVEIAAEASDSAATFTSSSRPSTRPLTSSRVLYNTDLLWLPASWNTLSDISPLVQEIIARPGWTNGSSLALILEGTGRQWGRKFVASYENAPAFAPRLVITYVLPGQVLNDVPVANPDSTSTQQDTPVTWNVVANDTDSSPLIVTSTTNGATGTAAVNGTTSVTYTPNAGFAGTDTITYTVCDPQGACSVGTVTINVIDLPEPPVTFTFRINAPGDDVNEDGANLSAAASSVWVGNGASAADSTLGLRFTGVNIPRGSVITSARVEFYSQAAQWISISANMAAEAADNSAAFSDFSRPSQRALTTSVVPHSSNVLWNAGSWNTLGEITGVVQEVVSRSGWQMGNSLSVIMDGLGSAYARKFVTAYEGGAAFAPRLVVTFIVPAEAAGLMMGLSDTLPPEPPAIVAGFTPSALQGLAPLAVTLSNTSTGPFDTVTWAVNDVPTSTESSPTLTFAAPGIYTVSLMVSGPAGSSTAQSVISVGTPAAPVAALSASVLSGTAPVSVQFTNLSSGAITGYAWDFGDGQSSTEASPAHTYTAAGTYTVTLITSGPSGMSSAQTTITVTEVPPESPAAPVASFSSSVGEDGITVSFTNSSTGEVTGYAWDFGDGQSSIEASPVHTYPAPGTYTVTLIVSGAGGINSTQAQVTITVPAS